MNLSEIRLEHSKAPRYSVGQTHEAVICKTIVSSRKSYIGVSYWSTYQIKAGTRKNDDGTTSVLIEPLYI